MADERRPEDPDTAADTTRAAEPDPRADERSKSPDAKPAEEVIDDDRFQATDN
jgi:hypothetical protein